MKRVVTAIVLAPVVLAVIFFAPDFYPGFVLLLVALAVLAVREFLDLAAAAGIQPYRRVGFVATAALVMWIDLVGSDASPRATLAAVVVIVLAVLIDCLARPERLAHSLPDAGTTLLGVLYPGLAIAVLGLILRDFGSGWLIWLMLVVWSGDVAALYAGRLWGRRRLAPQVSPNKTEAGAIAALLAALVVGLSVALGMGLAPAWTPALRWTVFAGLALGVSVAAQAGDLVESIFKRAAQVKDSGSLLPGHGGVLDRVDALLLAAPVLWIFLLWVPVGSRG